MYFDINGEIIDQVNGIPVVDDRSIKRIPKGTKKIDTPVYRLVSHGVSPAIIKKKPTPQKRPDDKPKKMSAYQLFNAIVKEEREKHKTFHLSGEEKMQKWKLIQQLLSEGEIKPTKKDFRHVIKH
jgi:NH3-dependent NAD+ synthetase